MCFVIHCKASLVYVLVTLAFKLKIKQERECFLYRTCSGKSKYLGWLGLWILAIHSIWGVSENLFCRFSLQGIGFYRFKNICFLITKSSVYSLENFWKNWKKQVFVCLFYLAVLCSSWDLSSPTRDRTRAPAVKAPSPYQ